MIDMTLGLVIGFICGFLVCCVQVANGNIRRVDKGDKDGNL